MSMKRLRDHILSRRRVKLSALYARIYDQRNALAGIDYQTHPHDYDEIDNALNRNRERAHALAQKL